MSISILCSKKNLPFIFQLFISLLFVSVFSMVSCGEQVAMNDANKSDTSADNKGVAGNGEEDTLEIKEILPELYLTRKDFEFFDKEKRAVVQFLRVRKDKLSLIAWKGKNNEDYIETSVQEFKISTRTDYAKEVDHLKVIFGDQKIYTDDLKDLAKNKDWSFLIFVPDLDTNEINGRRHVRYLIFPVKTLDEKLPTPVIATIYTNPSPPASIRTFKTPG